MNEDKNIVCENCGGTDFSAEGGFYYCTECQTQSQEIQERVYEHMDHVPVIQKRVKVTKDPTTSGKTKLTSWETYNYIVYGLVQELQALGADDNFKSVVYHLWLKYLTKLEYISENGQAKLGISYRKRDAEIVFQRKFKRTRKKGTSVDLSVSDMDDRMKFAERSKKRKLMERAEYDSLSVTMKSETLSLANQTLSGLSTDEETSISGHICYNNRSRKLLLKHMSKKHFEQHRKDVNNEMKCHKFTRKFIPQSYFRGPEILTKNKIYSLLYLALLLTQQDLQISDLIRYSREGHLSFLEYKQFFDTVDESTVDHKVYSGGKQEFPTYEFLRTFTFQLYEYLEIRPCNFSPNILKLCRRYCTELNLPDQIYNIIGDYIINSRPFSSLQKPTSVHNYEGRAMGFIIYILKILFGFDDVTEYELSKFATLVNKKNTEDNNPQELFNFSDWFNYIEYRKVVLKHCHFPTWYLIHPNIDCPLDLYVKFIKNRKSLYEVDESTDVSINVAKKYLEDLNLLQEDHLEKLIEFEPSDTPFRSYLKKLETLENFKVLNQPLNSKIIKDASKHTIEYLIEPHKYLKLINAEKCSIIFNNAHPNQKLKRIHTHLSEFFQQTYNHWEQKWDRDFASHKSESLAFDTLMDKILNKHLNNIASGTSFHINPEIKPAILPALEDKHAKSVRKSVGRNARGKFCKKSDPDALKPEEITPVKKGKWHVSSWNETRLINEYTPSLLKQVEDEEALKEELRRETLEKIKDTTIKKRLNKGGKYKYHYIPRMEYCSNAQDVSFMTKENFKEFEKTLPKNFQWLLTECARILEQSTKELYQEFVNVELYMTYIHFKKKPVESKPLSNSLVINKMIKNVQEIW